MTCILCDLWEREPENVIYEDDQFAIMNCLFKKGHRERIMLIQKEHHPAIRWNARIRAMNLAEEWGRKVFNYTYRFVVMDGTFGSIPEHWHVVITALTPTAFDFHQILATDWLATYKTALEFIEDESKEYFK